MMMLKHILPSMLVLQNLILLPLHPEFAPLAYICTSCFFCSKFLINGTEEASSSISLSQEKSTVFFDSSKIHCFCMRYVKQFVKICCKLFFFLYLIFVSVLQSRLLNHFPSQKQLFHSFSWMCFCACYDSSFLPEWNTYINYFFATFFNGNLLNHMEIKEHANDFLCRRSFLRDSFLKVGPINQTKFFFLVLGFVPLILCLLALLFLDI